LSGPPSCQLGPGPLRSFFTYQFGYVLLSTHSPIPCRGQLGIIAEGVLVLGQLASGLRAADGSSTRAAGGRRSGVGHALDGDLLGGGTLDKVVLATGGGVICGGGFSGGGALNARTVVTSAGKDVAASAVVALWVTWVELQGRARRWHRQPRHPGRWHSRVRGQPHRPQPETPCQHCPGQQQRPRRGRTRRRQRLSSGQQHWHIGHERQ
jgi:hypothetical protein